MKKRKQCVGKRYWTWSWICEQEKQYMHYTWYDMGRFVEVSCLLWLKNVKTSPCKTHVICTFLGRPNRRKILTQFEFELGLDEASYLSFGLISVLLGEGGGIRRLREKCCSWEKLTKNQGRCEATREHHPARKQQKHTNSFVIYIQNAFVDLLQKHWFLQRCFWL